MVKVKLRIGKVDKFDMGDSTNNWGEVDGKCFKSQTAFENPSTNKEISESYKNWLPLDFFFGLIFV